MLLETDADWETEEGGDVEPVMKHNFMTSFTYTGLYLRQSSFIFSWERHNAYTCSEYILYHQWMYTVLDILGPKKGSHFRFQLNPDLVHWRNFRFVGPRSAMNCCSSLQKCLFYLWFIHGSCINVSSASNIFIQCCICTFHFKAKNLHGHEHLTHPKSSSFTHEESQLFGNGGHPFIPFPPEVAVCDVVAEKFEEPAQIYWAI